MKKLAGIIAIFVFTIVGFTTGKVLAADTPIYDATFDNNNGAFYANGTDIVVSENSDGKTVVTWDGGSQIISNTTTVFGGGKTGTSYSTSNIIMNGGTVDSLVAGGVSTVDTAPANVETATITVNGGSITNNVAGGGYLYTTVDNSTIIINNGTIGAVTGGGFASVTIDGVYYQSGTESAMKDSGTRVNTAQITINGGTFYYPSTSSSGLVYGGGQGYSYTGNTTLTINGGDMSKAYVTAGGSNGYTENADVKITGGDIMLYQSVNRGVVDSATTELTGGTVSNFYVGGEVDPTVTGIINNSDLNLLGGTISNLYEGTSNGTAITIDNEKYAVVKTEDVKITNDNIKSGEVEVTYTLDVTPEEVTLDIGETADLTATIVTTPAGYESLFLDKLVWASSKEEIATVDTNGTITAVADGNAVVAANALNKIDTANVTVNKSTSIVRIFLIIFWIALIAILTLILVVIL